MFSLALLDARTKMLLIAAISTGALFTENLWFLAGLFVFTVLFLALGGVSIKKQAAQARTALGMVFFLFLLQAVFGQIQLGTLLCIRLLLIVMSALILLTGDSRDYLLGMVQCRIPYEIAYMVMIGLHFFPLLREEALDVFYSIQLRGTELKKTGLKKKLQIYLKISLPILAGAMERAKDTAISMEARAFRAYKGRTYMRSLKLKKRDKILIILTPILLAAFLFCATACSRQTEPPSQILLSQTSSPANSQAVSWYSSSSYAGMVRYGEEEPDQEQTAETVEIRPDEYYRYKAVLEGLKPGTAYCYQVGDGKTWSKTKSFRTAPADSKDKESVSFLYMGDIQYQTRTKDYEAWGKLLQKAWKQNPDLAFGLFCGDMVEKSGDIQDWTAFLTQAQPVFSRISSATVPGNHETSIIPYTYNQMLPLPGKSPAPGEVYSFDYGTCHVLMLNSCLFMEERIKDMGRKKWKELMDLVNAWIEQDLKSSSKTWNIAVMHHPPYPVEDDNELYKKIRKAWVPVLEQGKTDLVLCGHQHVYMRTREIGGITYIMGNSGKKQSYYYKEGAEFPEYVQHLERTGETWQVVTAGDGQLSVTAYDKTGAVLDQWEKKQ